MSISFGDRLKSLRIEKGYSIQELADTINVTKQTIINIESGRSAHPHGLTVRKLASFFGKNPLDLLSIPERQQYFDNIITNANRPTISSHIDWNLESNRSSIIKELAVDLSSDPISVTYFIDYFSMLTDFDWLEGWSRMQTTTLEYPQIWSDPDIFVPYEASFVIQNKSGRTIERMFIIHAARLNSKSYISTIRHVLHRHVRLCLNPRIIFQHENSLLSSRLNSKCDAFVILDRMHGFLVKYITGTEPALLLTRNENYCRKVSLALAADWQKSRTAENFLDKLDPVSKAESAEIDKEVDTILNLTKHLSRS